MNSDLEEGAFLSPARDSSRNTYFTGENGVRKGRKILGMNNKSPSNNYYSNKTGHITMLLNNGANANNSTDRGRVAGHIQQQEIAPMWPYAYIPQMMTPAPAFSMIQSPYPIPIYQTGSMQAIQPAAAPSPIRNPNEASNMLIQIGVQCVNQNNPVNINTVNDMNQTGSKPIVSAGAGPTLATPHPDVVNVPFESPSNNQETSFVDKTGKVEAFIKECNSRYYSSNNHASGDSFQLCAEKFQKVTKISLFGSDLAERLAFNHRNRPCFKKIDSLCARMKQDLTRPDGVLPNINSQGIAWAVKDFIFVFTRVINAWIIIKGYVYNTPEGLNRVKSALSPGFTKSFAVWQDATLDFVEDLITSFVNLDMLVQSQKMSFQKMDSPMKGSSAQSSSFSSSTSKSPESKASADTSDDSGELLMGKDKVGSLGKGYMYTLVEDSEESQRKAIADGSYFKTGTYNPIQKSPKPDTELWNMSPSKSQFEADFGADDELSKLFGVGEEPPFAQQPLDAAVGLTKLDPLPKHNNWLNYDIPILETNLSKYSNDYDENVTKPLGVDLIEKLNVIIDRVMHFAHASWFFKIEFTENYFPDFIVQHSFDIVDLQTIIMKCQVGGYWHIYEVIHDMKTVIYQARQYLKSHKNSVLDQAIFDYEKEVEELLNEKLFENYQFDHIRGEPNEILYNSGK